MLQLLLLLLAAAMKEAWARLLGSALALGAVCLVAPAAWESAGEASHALAHERIARAAARAAGAAARDAAAGEGLAAKANYRVQLSLLVGEGAAGAVGWDVEGAYEAFLAPLLGKLGALSQFAVDSQLLYVSRLVRGAGAGAGVVRASELAGFLSANDWNAETAIAREQRETALHLMVFLPARAPLAVLGEDGSSSSGFVVPRWGALQVLNESGAERSAAWLSASVLEPAFRRLAAQLCGLLALPLEPGRAFRVSDRDLERWLRLYASQAAEALLALSELAQANSAMTVLGRVRERVDAALDSLEAASELAEEGACTGGPRRDCLQRGVTLARAALEAAEQAFFDPSLLPQLYYPAEHWFAVFMPLILPSLVPVLRAVRNAMAECAVLLIAGRGPFAAAASAAASSSSSAAAAATTTRSLGQR